MISIEQLERLEVRIFQALDLISDLRIENHQLEKEIKRMHSANQKLAETNVEQERRLQSLDKELKQATAEIRDLRQAETALEHKIATIIARLDDIESVEVHRSSLLVGSKVDGALPSDSSSGKNKLGSILDDPDKLLQKGEDLEKDEDLLFPSDNAVLDDEVISQNVSINEQDIFISDDEVESENSTLEQEVTSLTVEDSDNKNSDSSKIEMIPEALEDVNLFEEDHDFMLLEEK